MRIINLSKIDWKLVGTKPYHWRLGNQLDDININDFENAPVRARVPGSVQQTLLDAGLIPDWNVGTNCRDIEWIENRHWLYVASIPDDCLRYGKSIKLRCNGLDDNGEVWINGQKIGEFNNTHLDYCFDLSDLLKPEKNYIAIIFFCPERYQGQVYWTSKTHINKPRFYYSWDWCPRIVQIGIWDDVFLEISDDIVFETIYSHTYFYVDKNEGSIILNISFNRNPDCEIVKIKLIDSEGNICIEKTVLAKYIADGLTINVTGIKPWFPNNEGEQVLYELNCTLLTCDNVEIQECKRKIGFRTIEWKSCRGTNPNVDPWLLYVNDNAVFVQGINWTPIRAMFADVSESQYRKLLLKYHDIGVNFLRVWGGATIEKECFYSLCDELGIMVWQEFPLSSSGLCNTPPYDDESITTIKKIAESYVRRRHYHASLIAWSGGNELYNKENTRPVDFSHPLINALREVLLKMDPGRRMMPASPSGPTIYYDAKLNGKGLQWDVHGPWCLPFEPSDDNMENIRSFWQSSDALFHSEVGVPGASPLKLMEKYSGDCSLLPINVENPYWNQCSWWIEIDKFKAEKGYEPKDVEEYILWQQNRQTVALSIAVESAKLRFPSCGGFVIWMGHDCFPCPANTSIFDFDGNPKPVVEKLKEIWLKTIKK